MVEFIKVHFIFFERNIMKPRKLKPEEIALFKTHAKHHSKKHIDAMKKFIRAGRGCFSESHKHAMKTTGK